MEKSSTLTQTQKEHFMQEALLEAKKAQQLHEVPIGAVVVLDQEVIGRGHNLRETTQNATMHAEMIAIAQACEAVGSWRLEKAQLFVTLEPCPMCAGATMLARVEEIYFGAFDPKGGASGSLLNLSIDERFNHWSYVEAGILGETCSALLTDFFRELRQRKKKLKKTSNSIELPL
ncbi:tRNA adenosine(34) deaminase TadA [Enterococcus bulliens]